MAEKPNYYEDGQLVGTDMAVEATLECVGGPRQMVSTVIFRDGRESLIMEDYMGILSILGGITAEEYLGGDDEWLSNRDWFERGLYDALDAGHALIDLTVQSF